MLHTIDNVLEHQLQCAAPDTRSDFPAQRQPQPFLLEDLTIQACVLQAALMDVVHRRATKKDGSCSGIWHVLRSYQVRVLDCMRCTTDTNHTNCNSPEMI